MTTFLSVFLGGGLGSILRHLVCSKIGNHWAVMSVNLMGAMLIGIAFEYLRIFVSLGFSCFGNRIFVYRN